MNKALKALFEGLVSDEQGRAASVAYVGEEPTYVIHEDGFNYHVDAHKVDAQVLAMFEDQVKGNEDLVSDSVMKMMGKDDLFTKAAINTNVRNFGKNLGQLFQSGLPEQARQYLGMLGFSVVINRHGDLLKVNMPSSTTPDEDEQ